MLYHDTKDAALLAGALYAEYWYTRAELEPYNGWVLILSPKTMEVFNWPLAPILEHAEIDMTGWSRLSKRPDDRRTGPPIHRPSAPGRGQGGKSQTSPSGPPVRGATGKVWEIADRMHAETPLLRSDRARVIAACEEAGINKATAATQWSKWAKAHNI